MYVIGLESSLLLRFQHQNRKNPCDLFCQEPQTHLHRHMRIVHGSLDEVQMIMKSKESHRVKMFDLLRGKGDYQHNLDVLRKKKGDFIVKRRPKTGDVFYHNFTPCNLCYTFVLKRLLSKHKKNCGMKGGDVVSHDETEEATESDYDESDESTESEEYEEMSTGSDDDIGVESSREDKTEDDSDYIILSDWDGR